MQQLDDIFTKLDRSPFRRRFRLRESELKYLREKGMDVILLHAAQFLERRMVPAYPVNDGKQTPYRNHPVFVAQHATATCCRGCLEKWHGIPKGKELSREETTYILEVLRRWLSAQEAPSAVRRGNPINGDVRSLR